MSTKNEKEKNRLQDEFEQLQGEEPQINPGQYMVTSEQMPDFGNIEIYDYTKDLTETRNNSYEIIEKLVELYIPEVKNHDYIRFKMKEDARIYANSQFLERMSEKLLIQQLKQIDSGDTSARLYEVVNQTMKEIRENNKDGRSARTEIEQMYKKMRDDLGLNELSSIVDRGEEVETNKKDEGRIIDTTDLNNKLEMLLKDKKV
jgi:hypothetical protein